MKDGYTPAKVSLDVEFNSDDEELGYIALKLETAVRNAVAGLFKQEMLTEPKIVVAVGANLPELL